MKKNADVAAVWKIGQALWQKDYNATYQAVNSFQWSQQLRPLVDAFVIQLRTRVLTLVANAYTNISSADLAEKLGQSETEAEQFASGFGFQYDANTKYYTPNKQALEAQLESNKKTGLDTISSLARKTLFLELN
jgi:COP9 signalosome complex subunit 8